MNSSRTTWRPFTVALPPLGSHVTTVQTLGYVRRFAVCNAATFHVPAEPAKNASEHIIASPIGVLGYRTWNLLGIPSTRASNEYLGLSSTNFPNT